MEALGEKPLKAFEVMKRVNIRSQDDCQSLLLKMRNDGAVRFDIHKEFGSLPASKEGGERRIDVVEFVAIVRAIGADPVKLLRDLMAGKPPAKPRRASARRGTRL